MAPHTSPSNSSHIPMSWDQSLRAFIAGTSSITTARGRTYAAQRRVDLKSLTESEISAVVRGTHPYLTSLVRKECTDSPVKSLCSCPLGGNCKHAVALAQHTLDAAVIPTLQHSRTATSPPEHATPRKQNKLLSHLAEHLGREPNEDERLVADKVTEIHQRISRSRWHSDFESELRSQFPGLRSISECRDLDFHGGELCSNILKTWSAVLATLLHFLPHIVPEAISSDSVAQQALSDLRKRLRSKQLREAEVLLSNATSEILGKLEDGETESWIGVRIGRRGVQLIKRTPSGTLRGAGQDFDLLRGVDLASQRVLEAFSSSTVPYSRYVPMEFPIADLLLDDLTATHVLGDDDRPLVRETMTLEWRLRRTNDSMDYELFLARMGEQQPVDGVLNHFGGSTPVYTTKNSYYVGPAYPFPLVQPPSVPIRLPCEVTESSKGAALLALLKVSGDGITPELSQIVHWEPELRISSSADGREVFVDWAWYSSALDRAEPWSFRDTTRTYSRARSKRVAEPVHLFTKSSEAKAWLEDFRFTRSGGATWLARTTREFPEDLLKWAQAASAALRIKLEGSLAALLKPPSSAQVWLNLEPSGIDWFDVSYVVDVAGLDFSPEEIDLLLKAQGRFVLLPKKGWQRLSVTLDPETEQLLASVGLSVNGSGGQKSRLHVLQLAEATERMGKDLSARHREIVTRLNSIRSKGRAARVPRMNAVLRPYQEAGFRFLVERAQGGLGGILADDMGLGKTLQALTFFAWCKGKKNAAKFQDPILVICPKTILQNWLNEAQKFSPSLDVNAWSTESRGTLSTVAEASDIVITTYPTIRARRDSFMSRTWSVVVLDEGQIIKNPSSLAAKVAKELHTPLRFILSGTPLENRVLDLWSLFDFCIPGLLGTKESFTRRFGTGLALQNTPFLGKLIAPFFLRRTKAEVAKELPVRSEIVMASELSPEQRKLYDVERKKAQAFLLKAAQGGGIAKLRFHVLTSLLKLRQICCHPGLASEDSQNEESGKLLQLKELLDQILSSGHRVLVFSQFVSFLDMARRLCEREDWKYSYLDGQTNGRADLVKRFQAGEGGQIFLISLKAGGVGLNLTAASYIILLDPWWNPAAENQAIDRAHRIGQTVPVTAYRLIAKDTIEEKVLTLQAKKAEFISALVDEAATQTTPTLEDLQALLE